MNLRSVHLVPLAAVLLLVSRSPDSSQGSYLLRIESLSRPEVTVQVSTANTKTLRNRVLQRDTVVTLPSRFTIPDSIDRVHIAVIGYALVRVTLTNSSNPSDSLVSEGRDIMFSRKPDGRFGRVWRAQPLLP